MTDKAPQKRNSRLPREQRMRDIENAARAVFAKQGYGDASIAQIAADAGVAEGTIYKFYDSKYHLLETLLCHWYREMIEAFHHQLRNVVGVQNRLRFIISQHLHSIEANPDFCRLFYAEVRANARYVDSELYRLNQQYTQVLLDTLRDAEKSGEIQLKVPMALVRDMVFGGLEHQVTAYLFHDGGRAMNLSEVAENITHLLMQGLLCEEQPPASDLSQVVERLERVAARLESQEEK